MNRIYQICIVCFTYMFYFGHTNITTPWAPIPLRYVDRNRKDLFFDRIMFLTLDIQNYIGDNRLNKHITSGVLIDRDHVLTSYNALRNLTKSKEMLEKIYICYVKQRRVRPPYRTFYAYECTTVQCGRPVVPMRDEDMQDDQWHGLDKKHSPLHDLMVLRLEDKLDIWEPTVEDTYEERHTPEDIKNEVLKRAGPMLTRLCLPTESLRKQIQFVSIGLSTKFNSKQFYGLELAEYEDSENTLTDCDNWLPRNWGYFFCLANDDDKYAGFANGAMLFSERKLFGVGSFTIWRGRESVIVFTDIRPYLTHINNTCTKNDLF